MYYVARIQVEDHVVYAAKGAVLAGKLLIFKKQLRPQFTSFYPDFSNPILVCLRHQLTGQSTNAWFSKLEYADLNQPKPQQKFN